jgi:hypothetical protein
MVPAYQAGTRYKAQDRYNSVHTSTINQQQISISGPTTKNQILTVSIQIDQQSMIHSAINRLTIKSERMANK